MLIIGTRFSNLYTAFPDETAPRAQTSEEDEIKELKFKFKEPTFSSSAPYNMVFVRRSLFRAYLHTMYYLWTHVVMPKGMSISHSTYVIIPSIGPFRTFGPIFSYFSSRIHVAHTTHKKKLV